MGSPHSSLAFLQFFIHRWRRAQAICHAKPSEESWGLSENMGPVLAPTSHGSLISSAQPSSKGFIYTLPTRLVGMFQNPYHMNTCPTSVTSCWLGHRYDNGARGVNLHFLLAFVIWWFIHYSDLVAARALPQNKGRTLHSPLWTSWVSRHKQFCRVRLMAES